MNRPQIAPIIMRVIEHSQHSEPADGLEKSGAAEKVQWLICSRRMSRARLSCWASVLEMLE